MDTNTKPWWQSRAVWASLVQAVLGVAVSLGWLNDDQAAQVFADAPDILVGAAMVIAAAAGLYGRVKATARVTLTATPTPPTIPYTDH